MAKCPQCSKKAIAEYKPFCSKRCADADLAAWITEKYRVSGPADTADSFLTPSEDDADDGTNIH